MTPEDVEALRAIAYTAPGSMLIGIVWLINRKMEKARNRDDWRDSLLAELYETVTGKKPESKE